VDIGPGLAEGLKNRNPVRRYGGLTIREPKGFILETSE
jgi:hypothetical protein